MPNSGHAHVHSVTNGFTPGGYIPAGYSYLDRAHSLVTPTRRSLPKGMAGTPSADESRDSSVAGDASSELSSSPGRLPYAGSLPDVSNFASTGAQMPAAPASTVLRKNSTDDSLRLSISPSAPADLVNIVDLVARLPSDPRTWMPSHVALYLTQVLGLTPKLIVDDVTAYVRNKRMSGRAFLRLREKDLAAEGLNLKWRKLMIAAVKKLRRDCIRTKMWSSSGENDCVAWALHDEEALDDEKVVAPSPAFAKGTLKRLRDKQAVRGIIFSFENNRDAGQQTTNSEDADIHRLQKRLSVSSLYSNSDDSPGGTLTTPMAPVYGEGYVRDRAASFSSPQAVSESKARIPAFTREQLELWFGDLTEKEANALADELESEQHHGEQSREDRGSSASSRHSHSSSLSGVDSALLTPSILDVGGFDLTPIDINTVNAIVESRSTDEIGDRAFPSRSPPPQLHDYAQSLHKDVLTDFEGSGSEHFEGAPSNIPRPVGWGQGHVNPYRRSTYEPQDLEALGLEPGARTYKFDTAKKMPRMDEDAATNQRGPAQDSIRMRKSLAAPSSDFRSLFSDTTTNSYEQEQSNITATQSNQAIVPERRERRDSSVEDEVAPLTSRNVGGNSVRKTATFGRAALAAALAKAQAEESTNEGGRRAENEREWGVTVSRKASRRNTLARSEVVPSADDWSSKEGSAAARMSQLFSPTTASTTLSTANLQKHEEQLSAQSVEAVAQATTLLDDALLDRDGKILVPLTAFEIDADGKKSIGKTSMVLVDRRRLDALAKRMGRLEEQLVSFESASLPPDTDLDDLSRKPEKIVQARLALEQVFASMPVEAKDAAPIADESMPSTRADDEENDSRRWRLLESFGAIPSYALGLAAGAGFVLLSEVFGRSRR